MVEGYGEGIENPVPKEDIESGDHVRIRVNLSNGNAYVLEGEVYDQAEVHKGLLRAGMGGGLSVGGHMINEAHIDLLSITRAPRLPKGWQHASAISVDGHVWLHCAGLPRPSLGPRPGGVWRTAWMGDNGLGHQRSHQDMAKALRTFDGEVLIMDIVEKTDPVDPDRSGAGCSCVA